MSDAISTEQRYVDGLYARVEELRAEVTDTLRRTRAAETGGAQSLLDRDARVTGLAERRAVLDHAEHGLCFGRLDRRDGTTTYVGRMGLRDAELSPLLVDWRAPAAADFYTATAASGSDVRRRRHIRTEGRKVVGVNDELLDLDEGGGTEEFVGEAALMEALTARRTGRMNDIVATLQAEQDEIIRSGPEGVLVVQGGPGTGKTAVALHRTAYLLYTHRQIAERGVLVLGPTPAFLAYIDQVLPSLGESRAVLATPDTLVPGVVVTRAEPVEVGHVKADARMAEVLACAVRARQPDGQDLRVVVDGDVHHLRGADLAEAAERALRTSPLHNVARPVFRDQVLGLLVDAVLAGDSALLESMEEGFEDEVAQAEAALARRGDDVPARVDASGTEVTGVAGAHERDLLRRELEADPGVARVLDRLWPALTPEELVEDLLTSPEALAEAAAHLGDAERALLLRAPGGGWSSADLPLLDEAAELLGEDTGAQDARTARRRAAEVRYAERVIAASGMRGAVSAEDLARRQAETDHRTLAERAAADRTWAYGHVIVDEAQELTPMQWRMVLRRVPTGSMTVVGDVHQVAAGDGTTSWSALAAAHPRRTWRHAELTVSYRTPAEVLAAARPVLRELDPAAAAPTSARSGGSRPWHARADDLASAVAAAAREELAALDGGHLAVIAPPARVDEIGTALADVLDDVSYGPGVDLEAACVVLSPVESKGLEFDGVLVADPAGILAAPRGLGALYVAMTRPTQRLGVLHEGDLPDVLARHDAWAGAVS